MCQPGLEPGPAVCETAMLTITPFCTGQKAIYSLATNASQTRVLARPMNSLFFLGEE